MERIAGVAFSDIAGERDQDLPETSFQSNSSKTHHRACFQRRIQAPEHWQRALTSALSVAAVSVIDGTAVFHDA